MGSVTTEILPAITTALPKIDSLLTAVTALVSDPAMLAAVKRLDTVMANLETATKSLSATMASTPAIATDAKATMTNVSKLSSDLAEVTARLRDMPIDSTFANIQAMTVQLNKTVEQLNSKDSSLGMLINDPTLYNNLTGATASLDSLLQDVKKNPKRYISIKLL